MLMDKGRRMSEGIVLVDHTMKGGRKVGVEGAVVSQTQSGEFCFKKRQLEIDHHHSPSHEQDI